MIKLIAPYIFFVSVTALLSLYLNSDQTHHVVPQINREIASDCRSMTENIISQSGPLKLSKDDQKLIESIKKRHHFLWNKIIGTKEFESFDDQEYFLWLQIYRDKSASGEKVNPISIEQKMALIEILNETLQKIGRSNLSTKKDILNLNSIKLGILNRHLKKMDLSSPLTRSYLNDFSSDLALILKGPPATLADYFTKNKTERMNERLSRMLYEDLLSYGLKGMLDRIPEKSKLHNFEKAKLVTKRIFDHKIWKLFVFPYDLPWFERVKIPDELLEKILLDGLDEHNDELITYLKSQDNIDHYERFRRIYKPIALSAAVYLFYLSQTPDGKAQASQEKEDTKKKAISEFNNMTDAILNTKSEVMKPKDEISHDIKEAQFQRVLKAFREEYKEEPSALEYQEMRDKIFNN